MKFRWGVEFSVSSKLILIYTLGTDCRWDYTLLGCTHTPLSLGATVGPVRTRERRVREVQAYKQAAKNLNRTDDAMNYLIKF